MVDLPINKKSDGDSAKEKDSSKDQSLLVKLLPISKKADEEDQISEEDSEETDKTDVENFDRENADIETDADGLLSFLEGKGKIAVQEIADDLGVPKKTVEVWAKSLEKSGYVSINYSAIKGMVLKYSADKSYDELNVGRSELSTDFKLADVAEVEEDEEYNVNLKGTSHVEDEEDEEEESIEEESIEDKSEEADKTDDSEAGKTIEESNEDSVENEKEEIGENEDDKEEESVSSSVSSSFSTNKHKSKLKDKLKELNEHQAEEKKTKEDEEDKVSDLESKKEKIRKKTSQVKKNTARPAEKSQQEKKKENQDKADSKDVKKEKSVNSQKQGNSHVKRKLGGHRKRLLKLGNKLQDPTVDNDVVFKELEKEMEGLKRFAAENNLDHSQKEEVEEIMDELIKGLQHAQSPKSGVKETIKQILTKIRLFLNEYNPIKSGN